MNSIVLLFNQSDVHSVPTEGSESIISSLVWNIVASIVFTGVIWLIQQGRYFFVLKRNIHNKKYKVYYKRFGTDQVMLIHCKTRQNRIIFEGNVLDGGKNPSIKGELIVNLINLKMADGYSLQDGLDAYVFMKVILTEQMDTFYVDAHYTAVEEGKNTNALGINNKIGTIVPQAFVWRKISQ